MRHLPIAGRDSKPALPRRLIAAHLQPAAIVEQPFDIIECSAAAFGQQQVKQRIRRNRFFVPELVAGFRMLIQSIVGGDCKAVAGEPDKVVITDNDQLALQAFTSVCAGNQRFDQLQQLSCDVTVTGKLAFFKEQLTIICTCGAEVVVIFAVRGFDESRRTCPRSVADQPFQQVRASDPFVL